MKKTLVASQFHWSSKCFQLFASIHFQTHNAVFHFDIPWISRIIWSLNLFHPCFAFVVLEVIIILIFNHRVISNGVCYSSVFSAVFCYSSETTLVWLCNKHCYEHSWMIHHTAVLMIQYSKCTSTIRENWIWWTWYLVRYLLEVKNLDV